MLHDIIDKIEEYKDWIVETNTIISDITDKIRNFDYSSLKRYMPK